MSVAEDRLLLGAAAVISPSRAAELLPWKESVAMAWLRAEGLILSAPPGDVVVWGDVIERLQRAKKTPEPEPRRAPRFPPSSRIK